MAQFRQVLAQRLDGLQEKSQPGGTHVWTGAKSILEDENRNHGCRAPGGRAQSRVVGHPQVAAEPMDDGFQARGAGCCAGSSGA
jgi:hypothetical protein